MADDANEIAAETAARFWRRVDTSGDCWFWDGPSDQWGASCFRCNGRSMPVRRVAYALQHGGFPDGKVLVSCGNILCVRGEHLAVEPRPPDDDMQRLWRYIARGSDAECWNWTGALKGNGYGAFQLGRERRRTVRPHRMLYEHLHGPQPSHIDICHKCDNRLCCNPAHLFAGTRADNMQDCAKKGRTRSPWGVNPSLVRGEANNKARLTVADVRAIRASGESGATLAARFGVTNTTISGVRRRRLWDHVE